MGTSASRFAGYVDGARGELLAKANLPPPKTTRWVPRRKAEVVTAVHNGLLSLHEACEMYTLTVEEFLSWQSAIERFGLAGLRATHAQEYRLMRKEKPAAARLPGSDGRRMDMERPRFEHYRPAL
jgi:hypothetical protein